MQSNAESVKEQRAQDLKRSQSILDHQAFTDIPINSDGEYDSESESDSDEQKDSDDNKIVPAPQQTWSQDKDFMEKFKQLLHDRVKEKPELVLNEHWKRMMGISSIADRHYRDIRNLALLFPQGFGLDTTKHHNILSFINSLRDDVKNIRSKPKPVKLAIKYHGPAMGVPPVIVSKNNGEPMPPILGNLAQQLLDQANKLKKTPVNAVKDLDDSVFQDISDDLKKRIRAFGNESDKKKRDKEISNIWVDYLNQTKKTSLPKPLEDILTQSESPQGEMQRRVKVKLYIKELDSESSDNESDN